MKKKPRITGTYKTLFFLPEIPDDSDPELKNALAIRNVASTSGVCPDCGAEPTLVYEGEVPHLVFEHEDDCHCFVDEER